MTKLGEWDAPAFYAALDAQRISKGITWKQVAAESGVAASTLTRMAQGRRPDVDSLAALVAWSGLKQEEFIRSGQASLPTPEPLAMISTLLRADKHLSAEAATALDELVRATYARMRRP
jgi:transcriptional regulator with XRE-family HTH domain